MDNCYRENKNRHHLAFCHVLVEKRWFSEIFVTFLPSGHTHEDIDRMFRRYHDLRKCEDCDTASDFVVNWVTEAYRSNVPKIKYVIQRYDWKAWLNPHLHQLGQHSFFRAFHFFRDTGTDLVVFKVKQSPLDDGWTGRSGANSVGFEMIRSTPPGFPNLLPYTPMDPEHFSDVHKLFDDLSPSTIAWWRHFFRDQKFWCPSPPTPAFQASIWDLQPPVIDEPPDDDAMPEGCRTTAVQRELRMPNQRVISLDELSIGCLCAVRPSEGFYDDSDLDAPLFWIGEVVEMIPDANEVTLRYYRRSKKNSQIFNRCAPDIKGNAKVVGILAHNFRLTTLKHVFRTTLKTISNALEHDDP